MFLKVNQDDLSEYPNTTQHDLAFSPMKFRRRANLASQESVSKQSHCYFFEKPDIISNLHATTMLEVDKRVRNCAVFLNDNKLIAKLSTGDMKPTEAKYHGKCLVGLYNKVRKVKSPAIARENSDNSVTDLDLEERAFAKVIAYVNELMDTEEMAVLRLADLPLPDDKVVYSTSGPNVLSTLTTRKNMDRIQPCTHEEADARPLLNALDAQRCGYIFIL